MSKFTLTGKKCPICHLPLFDDNNGTLVCGNKKCGYKENGSTLISGLEEKDDDNNRD